MSAYGPGVVLAVSAHWKSGGDGDRTLLEQPAGINPNHSLENSYVTPSH